MATQSQIDELDQQAKDEALASVRYADESPDLTVDDLYTDVYSQPFGPYRQGELPIMLKEDPVRKPSSTGRCRWVAEDDSLMRMQG